MASHATATTNEPAARPGPAVDFLVDLIRMRTDAAGDRLAAARRVEAEFAALGLPAELRLVLRPDGAAIPTVIGWIGAPSATPDLILNAHLDTAPEGDGWSLDPHAGLVERGRIWGRGAFTKADVAIFLHAAAAALRAGAAAPKASIAVAITADEGDGGDHGVRHLLDEGGLHPARALCNGITRSVTIAHCGCVQARIRLHGRGCHQAVVDPATETMRHAVALARRLEHEDEALRRTPSPLPGIASPTLNVTGIRAGTGFGMAPATAELWVDRRTIPDEDVARCAAGLRTLVETFAAEHGIVIDHELARQAEPLRPTPGQRPWAALVQAEAQAVLKAVVPFGGLPVYTDARWFAAAGIPTVMYGAGASDLRQVGTNGPDENVALDDIEAALAVVTRVVTRIMLEAEEARS